MRVDGRGARRAGVGVGVTGGIGVPGSVGVTQFGPSVGSVAPLPANRMQRTRWTPKPPLRVPTFSASTSTRPGSVLLISTPAWPRAFVLDADLVVRRRHDRLDARVVAAECDRGRDDQATRLAGERDLSAHDGVPADVADDLDAERLVRGLRHAVEALAGQLEHVLRQRVAEARSVERQLVRVERLGADRRRAEQGGRVRPHRGRSGRSSPASAQRRRPAGTAGSPRRARPCTRSPSRCRSAAG